MSDPQGTPAAGEHLAHYRIIGRLGAGGMGEVYRAHDEKLGRDVALKLLPPEMVGDEVARARLEREARTASALNHPHICTIHEVGEARGRTYIAMELVPGETLDRRIPPHGLASEAVARYGVQIADALAHAHQHGVVHRDLKSANVMVTPEGRVKVMDFGLARNAAVPGAGGSTKLTSTGVIVGSPQYIAPEVLRGEPADARSDLWALGVVLYEMATGALPFRGQSVIELGAAILNAEPVALPDALPAGLRSIVLRCLAKDPARRYQRADEVRAALETVGSDSPAADAPAAGAPAATRPARRSRWLGLSLAAGAAVIAALLTTFFGGSLRRLVRGGEARHIRSLAVLPLENLSGDKDQEYFADGMTEELIASLGNLENLRVISRTSVMRFKGTTRSIPQIARELGVDAVIEGSALHSGDRVRITAQLIDAADDRHLWAHSYEREMRNVLTLQGEVAQAIATEIRTSLNARGKLDVSGRRVVIPAAYESYLQGRFFWSKRNPAALKLAIRHFERAIEIDPGYALAYAGLAEVYAVVADYIPALAREAPARARAAASHALELDPTLAGPHAVLAIEKMNQEHDWSGAEAEFLMALKLDPLNTSALHWLAGMYSTLGRGREALAVIDRALAVDPLGLILRNTRGNILEVQNRREEASAEYRRVLELDPTFYVTYFWVAMHYEMEGRYALAVANYRTADSLAGSSLNGYDAAMRAAAAGAPRAYWRAQLVFLGDSTHRDMVFPSLLARCYARLGEKDNALLMLQRALDTHDGLLPDVIREAALEPLRSDPRFTALLRRYGLEP